MQPQESEGAIQPKIVRGRVDSLSLYEITDYELQVPEEGSVGATYLNFAVFVLSVAASFLATLLTTRMSSDRVFLVLVVVVVVGFAMGGTLLVFWYRTRRGMSKALRRIKDRCLPPPTDRTADGGTTGGTTEASAG